MITDMVGYTRVTQRNETLALSLLEEHRRICRPLFAAHHGREIKTLGDGFLVAFERPLQAVQCAIDIQQAIHQRNEGHPVEGHILLRIGIHWDYVVFQEDDVFGNGVNVAARLEPLSDGGGVCLSSAVYEQVKKLEVPILSLGSHALKNIQKPLGIYKIALPGTVELAGAPTLQPEKSIAVLPFDNLSPAAHDYFSDGLSEDITGQLTRIAELKVISRTSAMKYKGVQKNLRQVATELGVTYVLEGSVRTSGQRVRIAARLVHTPSNTQIWADSYDRKLTDIFAIQIEVARTIAAALKARISAVEQQRIERTPTDSLEAYQLYLKGRYHWAKRTEGALQTAIAYFEEAIARDPNYAQAYAGLAQVYSTLGDWIWLCPKLAYPQAQAAAEKALALNPLSAKAMTALGHVNSHMHWHWEEAQHQFQRAIELNPSYGTAHHWYGECLAAMGHLGEALFQLRRAHELDPFSLQINASLGLVLYFQDKVDPAIAQYERTLAVNDGYFAAHLFLGIAYLRKDLPKLALVAFERAALCGAPPLTQGWRAFALARAGRREDARALLEALRQTHSGRYLPPFALGLACWGLGLKREAFEAFAQACEDRTLWLVYLLRSDPLFAPWRVDRRCQDLLRRMRLDPARRAKSP